MFKNAYIPYKGYYSSPFVRWQGSLSTAHPVRLAGATIKRWMGERHPSWDPMKIDYVFMGATVAMKHAFWNGPWVAALLGAERTVGVWLSLACATGTTAVFQAAMACEVGADWAQAVPATVFRTARTQSGSSRPRGYPEREDWVMDNFNADPDGSDVMKPPQTTWPRQGITKENAMKWPGYISSTRMGLPTIVSSRSATCSR